jgi:hypothetical protein
MRLLRAYLTLGTLGTIASIVGIVGGGLAIANSLGGSGGSVTGGGSGPPFYSPGGLQAADTEWQNFLGALGPSVAGAASATEPNIANSYYNMLGIPTAPLQTAANEAGAYQANMAGQADQFHNLMSNQYGVNTGAAGNLMGAGNALWNTAQDPQNALFNKLLGQTTDASRAATSARGIGMSPEAAGIENQDVQNMLINWQNQQLGRQAQGLQGMTGAYQQAGAQGQAGMQDLIGSQTMSALAPQLLQQSAQTPYNTAMSIAQEPMNASNQFSQAMQGDIWGPMSNMMNLMIPYMNFGSGQQQNAFNQGQTNLNNLTSGLSTIGSQFGPNSPFAGMFNTNFSTTPPNFGPSSTSGQDSGYGFGGG